MLSLSSFRSFAALQPAIWLRSVFVLCLCLSVWSLQAQTSLNSSPSPSSAPNSNEISSGVSGEIGHEANGENASPGALFATSPAPNTSPAPTLLSPPVWPQTALTGESISVSAVKAGYLLDPQGELDILDVIQRRDFKTFSPYRTFNPGRDGAVWLRLRVQVPLDNNSEQATHGSDLSPWMLELPAPLLDDVQLYQIGQDGRLLPTQKAGDLLPNAQWSHPANNSSFKLNLYAGESTDLWLRVQYPSATQLPILLKSEQQYLRDSRSYFGYMGVVFGAMLFLCLYVLIMVISFKDLPHLAFGAYLACALATLFAYSGINGYLIFDSSPRWIDASAGVWQLLSSAAALFFVGTLLQAPARTPRLATAMMAIGALSLLGIPCYILFERSSVGAPMVLVLALASCIACCAMGVIAWQLGDKTARIITVFYALLIANIAFSMVGVLEWLHFFWYEQTFVYALMVIALPLILAEMNFKMRHQLTMQVRALGMRSHDALTDSLNEPFFMARLRTFMTTPRKRKNAALVLIDVSNLPFMRENFAQDIVEQTLLRAVIKSKRVFGEMDAIGRIGDHYLAVLIENTDRERVNKLAVELIASGLMPSQNLKQDITIVFHFAIELLDHYDGDTEELLPALKALCRKMSPRTQRPIRYLGDAGNAPRQRSHADSHGGADSQSSSLYSTQLSSGFASSNTAALSLPVQLDPYTSGSSGGAAPSSSFHR